MPDTWTVFSTGGFAGLVFLIGTAGLLGKWRWGREFDAMVAEKERQIADRDRQLAAVVEDRDYWRDMSVDLLRVSEQQAQVTGAAIGRRKAS